MGRKQPTIKSVGSYASLTVAKGLNGCFEAKPAVPRSGANDRFCRDSAGGGGVTGSLTFSTGRLARARRRPPLALMRLSGRPTDQQQSGESGQQAMAPASPGDIIRRTCRRNGLSRTGASLSLLGVLLASLLSPAAAEEMDASPECKCVIVTHLHEVVKQCGGVVDADAESRYLVLRNILEEHLKLWPNDLHLMRISAIRSVSA
jgi:hypothetical protein